MMFFMPSVLAITVVIAVPFMSSVTPVVMLIVMFTVIMAMTFFFDPPRPDTA